MIRALKRFVAAASNAVAWKLYHVGAGLRDRWGVEVDDPEFVKRAHSENEMYRIHLHLGECAETWTVEELRALARKYAESNPPGFETQN